ncbi:MAG: peptide ligase PGM1-related protein [Gaiellaceae bacterium]
MEGVERRYAELQERMRALWPTLTLRAIGDEERTVVVVHSISLDVPDHIAPVFPAYEERFLCFVLSLLRAPRSRVVYVTSQPILPRLVDYWFRLVPELDTPEARQRLTLVALSDGSNQPLTKKLLRHPRVLERIRGLVSHPEHSLIVPFAMSRYEVELAVRLGLPIYGCHPGLLHWGTKTGSRRIFAEEDVPHPAGTEGVSTLDDVIVAIREIRARRPDVREVVVKLDRGVGGLGNGVVRVEGAETRRQLERRALEIRLEDDAPGAHDFYEALASESGIVEERIVAGEVRSPSVQMRASPTGDVEILSTHDQVLGGTHGQTYLGSLFPADTEYAALIAWEALKAGRRLAREGAIGRFAVDFVVSRDGPGEWRPSAIEINLRAGGTTHPFMALQALTDGDYVAPEATFIAHGAPKFYVATDHLESPRYAVLTPEDFLDVVAERGLAWDPESGAGLAFHLVSALAVAGRIGVTAIGNTREEARSLYTSVERALEDEVSSLTA